MYHNLEIEHFHIVINKDKKNPSILILLMSTNHLYLIPNLTVFGRMKFDKENYKKRFLKNIIIFLGI
jgi:hypothetical protein